MFKPLHALAALLLLAISTQGIAVEIPIRHHTNAVVGCQAALPAFEGLIRKRPKAVANEGLANAFITCGSSHNQDRILSIDNFDVRVANRTNGPVTISCTLVDGLHDLVFSPTTTKSLTLAANTRESIEWWYYDDNGNMRYTVPSVSCMLPPGTEINAISVIARDEVGP